MTPPSEQSTGARWTLQVCPVCGSTVLDENHVRDNEDESLGGPCESCQDSGDENAYMGPMDVVEVMPVVGFRQEVKPWSNIGPPPERGDAGWNDPFRRYVSDWEPAT